MTTSTRRRRLTREERRARLFARLAALQSIAQEAEYGETADTLLGTVASEPYPLPSPTEPPGITPHTREILARAGIPEGAVPKYDIFGTAKANLRKDVLRPYVTPEMVQKLPGPLQPIGTAARELTSPTQLALMLGTAGLGPTLAAGIKGGTGAVGAARGIASGAVSPVLQGSLATRLAGEAAVGTGATLAGQETAKRVQNAPTPIRVAAPLAAGLAGGLGTLGAIQAGRAALKSVPEIAAGEKGAVGKMPEEPTKPVASEARSPAAKPAQATETASEAEFAANIRLSKFSEDLRPIIKEWADANPDAVEAARRGVRPDAQVLEDARKLVNDLGGDFEKMVKQWKPGQAWNAEEITAIRGALADSTRDIVDVQAAIVAGIDTSENNLRLVEAVYRRAQIQEAVHGITAEAGRSLRAFRQQATEALQNKDTVRMAALLKQLEGKGSPEKIAAELAKIDMNNPQQVSDLIRSFTKPKWWEYALELRINGYLSAFSAQTINFLSNAAMVGISPVRRGLAATLEAGIAPLQGRERQRFFSEAPADVVGAIQGIPEGLRSFLYVMRNGQTPETALKYELPRVSAFGGRLGVLVNAPSRAMMAADQLYYHINYRAALSAEAVRTARRSPKAGMGQVERAAELINNPSTELIEKARKIAEYNLFREEPGSITKWLLAGRNNIPGMPFLVPFIRTPVNLLKVGWGHSPLGITNAKMWGELARKDPVFADKFASVLLGTAVASTLAIYYAKGLITGPAPTNAAERNTFFNVEHKLPYAVKIGGRWIPYNRLAPFDRAIGLVGSVIQAYELGDDATAEAKASIVGTMLGKQFLDMPYMTGLSDIMDAMDSTERAATWLERFAAGGLPYSALLRQTATTIDPTYRRPEGLVEQFQAEIPGQTQNVPPRVTAFGEEAQRTSPSMLPFAWSPADMNPVEAELTKLNIDAGFVSTTVGGVKLTRQQQQAYQVLAGQLAMQNLTQVIDVPLYQSLPNEMRVQVLEAVMNAGHRQARYQLKLGNEPKPSPNSIRPLRILERITLEESPLVKAYQAAGDTVLQRAGHEDLLEEYHEYLKADNLTQKAMDKQYKNLFSQTSSATSSVKAKMREKNALLDGYYVRYADGAPKHKTIEKRYTDVLNTDTALADLIQE